MTRRQLLVILILVSTSFNLLFFVAVGIGHETHSGWPFTDLGPAVIQDSYHDRVPALESPFGMIGDVPGGYSPYSGNPLQNEVPDDLSDWLSGETTLPIEYNSIEFGYLFLAALIALVPLLVVIIAGRRSFGSAKTQ